MPVPAAKRAAHGKCRAMKTVAIVLASIFCVWRARLQNPQVVGRAADYPIAMTAFGILCISGALKILEVLFVCICKRPPKSFHKKRPAAAPLNQGGLDLNSLQEELAGDTWHWADDTFAGAPNIQTNPLQQSRQPPYPYDLSPLYQQLFSCLMKKTNIDLQTLKEELQQDTWTESTLPIEVIKQAGGTDFEFKPWQDCWTRVVSYRLRIFPGVKSLVETTCTVRAWPGHLSLELVSVTHAPLVRDCPVHTLYTFTAPRRDTNIKLSGFVEWQSSLPAAAKSAIERGIQASQKASIQDYVSALGRRSRA